MILRTVRHVNDFYWLLEQSSFIATAALDVPAQVMGECLILSADHGKHLQVPNRLELVADLFLKNTAVVQIQCTADGRYTIVI